MSWVSWNNNRHLQHGESSSVVDYNDQDYITGCMEESILQNQMS